MSLARSYLEDNYAANISLDTLARLVGLSPFHLARLFEHEVGMPPHAYQIQARIAHAKPLLLQGLPVSRVAVEQQDSSTRAPCHPGTSSGMSASLQAPMRWVARTYTTAGRSLRSIDS